MLEDSRKDVRFVSRGLDSKKKWLGTISTNGMKNGMKTCESIMLNFAESGHPVFRATTALERGAI